MLATVFLIVALVLFILSIFGIDGRLLPAGLAFLTAAFLFANGIPG